MKVVTEHSLPLRPSGLTGSIPGMNSYYSQFRSTDVGEESVREDGGNGLDTVAEELALDQPSFKYVVTDTFPFFAKVFFDKKENTSTVDPVRKNTRNLQEQEITVTETSLDMEVEEKEADGTEASTIVEDLIGVQSENRMLD